MSAEAIASMLWQAAWCWVHAPQPSSVDKLPGWQVRSRRAGDEHAPESFSGLIMIAQPSGRNSSSDYHYFVVVFFPNVGLTYLPLTIKHILIQTVMWLSNVYIFYRTYLKTTIFILKLCFVKYFYKGKKHF